MAEGRIEDCEILLQHGKIALANLENATTLLHEGGQIMKMIESDSGKKLQQYAEDCANAMRGGKSKPHLSKSSVEKLANLQKELGDVMNLLEYVYHWKRLVEFQFQRLNHIVRELDFRWNYQYTLRTVELFVTLARVCLLTGQLKMVCFVANLIYTTESGKSEGRGSGEFLDFIKQCQKDPLGVVAATTDKIKETMSFFISRHCHFYSVLFADWTSFDWSILSLYEVSPDETIGQSMPKDEYLLLTHMKMMSELITLFLLTYPDYLKEHEFLCLAAGVMSEFGRFSLSRQISISMEQLMNMRNEEVMQKLILRVNDSRATKFKTTHVHRMVQLVYILGDLENFAGMDKNLFLRCIHQTRAASAFAYYQLDQFLNADDSSLYDQYHMTVVMELVELLSKLTDFFIREKDNIERFFAFNLCTTDAPYLDQLADALKGTLDKVETIVCEIKDIASELKEISLPEFESGVRYDMYPLILTCGRLLKEYNIVCTNYHISYLNPLFEHLSSIIIHSYACQNAVSFFLDACEIHTMWRFKSQILKILPLDCIAMDKSLSFIKAFAYYNYDYVSLSACRDFRESNGGFDKVKGEIQKKLTSMLTSQLKNDSRLMKYTLAGEIGQPVEVEQSARLRDVLKNPEFCERESRIVMSIADANHFLYSIPNSVFLFMKDEAVADQFRKSLTESLGKIVVLSELSHTGAITETTETLWTLFGQLGMNYPKSLYKEVLQHGFFAGASLADQAEAMIGNKLSFTPVKHLPMFRDEGRFIHTTAERLIHFALEGHKKTKYIPAVERFHGRETIYSTQYFMRMIKLFGHHAALYLDYKLIDFVCEKVMEIVDIYSTVSSTLINSKNQPMSIAKHEKMPIATEAFLSIAVAMTLRMLIRRASELVANETIYGLPQLITQSINKLSPAALVLIEALASQKSNFFIQQRLIKLVKSQCTSPPDSYFAFLAALFINMEPESKFFHIEEQALGKNYHILPYAWDVMVTAAPILFQKASIAGAVEKGIEIFFSGMSQIEIENQKVRKQASNTSEGNCSPLLIIIDGFIRFIPELEFEKIEQLFPYTLISSGYPATDITKSALRKSPHA